MHTVVKFRPENNSGLNGILRYRCSALPTVLSRQLRRKQRIKDIIHVIHTSLAVNVILLKLRWSIMASYLSPHLKYLIIRIFIYIFHLRRVLTHHQLPPGWLDSSVERVLHRSVLMGSWAQISFRPEFFPAFISQLPSCVYNSEINHDFISSSAVKIYDIYILIRSPLNRI